MFKKNKNESESYLEQKFKKVLSLADDFGLNIGELTAALRYEGEKITLKLFRKLLKLIFKELRKSPGSLKEFKKLLKKNKIDDFESDK